MVEILGKMGHKGARSVLDDELAGVLDDVHDLVRLQTDEKTADKVVKNIVKVVVKIGINIKNKRFSEADLDLLNQVRQKFKTSIMSLISFYEVPFSYDPEWCTGIFNKLNSMLQSLMKPHMTAKSLGRLDMVFAYFADPKHMDSALSGDAVGPIKQRMGVLSAKLTKMIEEDKL